MLDCGAKGVTILTNHFRETADFEDRGHWGCSQQCQGACSLRESPPQFARGLDGGAANPPRMAREDVHRNYFLECDDSSHFMEELEEAGIFVLRASAERDLVSLL